MSHIGYIIINGTLALFFLFLTIRAKNPIYLLGIPFLIFMGRAIFFEVLSDKLTQYTGLNGIWAMVFFLAIVWFVNIIWYRRRNRTTEIPFTFFGRVKPFTGEIPIILLSLLWFINTTLNCIRFNNTREVLVASFDASSIFICYILIRGIIANAGLVNIVRFIESLGIITAISALVFLLQQALNITIFEYNLNVTSFGGGIVSRNTYYFPPLVFMLFCYGLARKKWDIFTTLTWIIAFLAYIFSYTRTYILGSVVLINFAYIIKWLRFKTSTHLGKLSLMLAGISIGGLIIYYLLPVQTTYMLERVSQGFDPQGSGPQNLVERWSFITDTWESISPNQFLGIGSPGIANFPYEFWAKRHVFDSWVVLALQYWGVAGIALIIALFYSGIRLSIKYFSSDSEKFQFIGLLFMLILIAVMIEGIFGPIFMEPYRYPLGFWYFALLYGITSTRQFDNETASSEEL